MIAEIVRSKRTSSPLKCEQFPNHVRNSVYECITNSRSPDTHTPTHLKLRKDSPCFLQLHFMCLYSYTALS